VNQIATALSEALRQVRTVHTPGHRCTDGRWYNAPVKGNDCPTAEAMTKAILGVTALAGQARAAAEDPAAVAHVLWAATGFDAEQLRDEDREAWMTTARDGILGLAGYLNGDREEVAQDAEAHVGGAHRAGGA
jgi:hypothetical protein